MTTSKVRTAEELAGDFVRVYATLDDGDGVFAPDVLFDVNVPHWRFQLQGPGSFAAWLREHTKDGYDLRTLRVAASATGFTVELEGRYGEGLYFRNLVLCEVRDGLIGEVAFYCTGDWDPATQRRHAAGVRLIRP